MSSYQYRRRIIVRKRILDAFILTLSLGSIIGALGMIFYCAYQLKITSVKPYIMFFIIIGLGLFGIRIFQKEAEI
ncbi:MAG: hypothetical protein DRO88_04075 [Promethearchaeia archaeon]|nr:MAG: hypothetical protein DRO88_04075 [Candidatus Lokiarchaeia archaeon]